MGVQWVWRLVTEPGVHKSHSLAPTPGSQGRMVSTNQQPETRGQKEIILCAPARMVQMTHEGCHSRTEWEMEDPSKGCYISFKTTQKAIEELQVVQSFIRLYGP